MAHYTNAIQKLYVAYFSRPADVAGLAYWDGVVSAANGSTAAVSAAFAASAEYKAAYAGLDAYATVDKVYLNLFGRHAEPAGLNFWGQNLLNGKLTIDAVVTAVAAGAQGTDLVAYNSKVAAATAFTAALDTSSEILGYSGATANAGAANFIAGVTDATTLAAAVVPATLDATVLAITTPQPVGTTFTLTDSFDTFVGTGANDTFLVTTVDNLGNSTLTTFDDINGGAGNDALNVIDPNTAAGAQVTVNGAGSTISGIETVSIRSTGGVIANTSTMTGVTKLNVAAQGTAAVAATVAATTDVNVASANVGTGVVVNGGKQVIVTSTAVGAGDVSVTGAALTNVSVSGGNNVAISNTATGTTLTGVSIFNVAGATTSVTGAGVANLSLSNLGQTAAHTVTVNNATAGHAINAQLVAVGTSANVVTLVDDVATSANLSAVTESNISLTGAKIATANISGAGALSLNAAGVAALTAVNGAAATGAITLTNLSNKVMTVATGSANDTVTLTSLTTATANASVSTGAGNDSITLATSGAGIVNVVAGDGDDKVIVNGRGTGALSIDLGAGTDTLSAANGIFINAGDTVNAGAGVDTLTLALVGSANIGAFAGFELFDAVGMNKDLDVDILVSRNQVTEIVASGAVGVANLTNIGAGVSFRATGDMTGSTLGLSQKVAGAITIAADKDETGAGNVAADTLTANVTLNNATAANIVFDSSYVASVATEATVGDNVTTFNVGAANIASATVVSGGALSNNVLNLTASAKLASLTITGAQALTLTSPVSTVLTNVDASASTGGLTATTASLANAGTFKLGSGVDKITIDLATSTTAVGGAEQISGMEKAAAVSLSVVVADATAKAAAQADADTIVLAGGSVADAATVAGGAVSANGVLTFTGAGPSTLTAAFLIADSAAALGEVLVFNYLNDSYVFMQGATDVAVKLVGVTGITGIGEAGVDGFFFV